jgi:hypothetical protein
VNQVWKTCSCITPEGAGLPVMNVDEAFGSFAAGIPERKTTSKAHIPD